VRQSVFTAQANTSDAGCTTVRRLSGQMHTMSMQEIKFLEKKCHLGAQGTGTQCRWWWPQMHRQSNARKSQHELRYKRYQHQYVPGSRHLPRIEAANSKK
jgi:hypothetical protein